MRHHKSLSSSSNTATFRHMSLLLLITTVATAFVIPTHTTFDTIKRTTTTTTTTRLKQMAGSSNDWNNDDYLNALSGSKADLNAANKKYYDHAEVLARMRGKKIDRPDFDDDDDNDDEEEPQQQQTPPPRRQAPIDPYQQAPPPPPIIPTPTKSRNRDADQIANTSDVYLAQLKLDSRIRKQAFFDGDNQTFNKAFDDQRVKDLKDSIKENPYTKKAKQELVDTSGEEYMAAMEFEARTKDTRDNKQISFRDKLRAAQQGKTTVSPVTQRRQQQQQQQQQTPVVPPPQMTTPVTTPPPPSVSSVPPTVTAPPPPPLSPPIPTTTTTTTAATTTPPVSSSPVVTVSEEELTASLDYMAAAIAMYKVAPPSEKRLLLPTIRSALLSGLDRLDGVV